MKLKLMFSYRLDGGGTATTEASGYSLWHLLAAGLIRQSELENLLVKSALDDTDTLLDDLREGMAIFPHEESWRWRNSQLSVRSDLSSKSVRAGTAWKTPRQICLHLGRHLLAGYWYREEWLHRVVAAFQAESCRAIGLCPRAEMPE